jgi:hypothetical protein
MRRPRIVRKALGGRRRRGRDPDEAGQRQAHSQRENGNTNRSQARSPAARDSTLPGGKQKLAKGGDKRH